MIANTNLPGMTAQRNLYTHSQSQLLATQRLSTGYRINQAADDAAGLALSEYMRNQLRGVSQAIRNSQDGISLIQTAEGALEGVHRILERIRQLNVQAASDGTTHSDRGLISLEIHQLIDEIDHITDNTHFNNLYFFQGPSGTRPTVARSVASPLTERFSAGVRPFNANFDTQLQERINSFTISPDDVKNFMRVEAVSRADIPFHLMSAALVNQLEFSETAYAIRFDREGFGDFLLAQIQQQILDHVPGAAFNADGVDFLNTIRNVPWTQMLMLPPFVIADDAVWSAGFAEANNILNNSSNLDTSSVPLMIAIGLSPGMFDDNSGSLPPNPPTTPPVNPQLPDLSMRNPAIFGLEIQSGPNAGQRIRINIYETSRETLGLTHFMDHFLHHSARQDTEGISYLLDHLDASITQVSRQRAILGGTQNRLAHTINSLQVAEENLAASHSRIRDTDMAKEMMRLTQADLLSETGRHMMAHSFVGLHTFIEYLM